MAEAGPDLFRGSVRTIGRVRALGPALVSIATPDGRAQRLTLSNETVVMLCHVGTSEDVRVGTRILPKIRHGTRDALEAVVLPAESIQGFPVVDATSDSITFKNLLGELVTVNATGARIDTTVIATINDLFMGSTIFVRARRGERSVAAVEVIVLPEGTAFGTE
jgi:hypothetical protein